MALPREQRLHDAVLAHNLPFLLDQLLDRRASHKGEESPAYAIIGAIFATAQYNLINLLYREVRLLIARQNDMGKNIDKLERYIRIAEVTREAVIHHALENQMIPRRNAWQDAYDRENNRHEILGYFSEASGSPAETRQRYHQDDLEIAAHVLQTTTFIAALDGELRVEFNKVLQKKGFPEEYLLPKSVYRKAELQRTHEQAIAGESDDAVFYRLVIDYNVSGIQRRLAESGLDHLDDWLLNQDHGDSIALRAAAAGCHIEYLAPLINDKALLNQQAALGRLRGSQQRLYDKLVRGDVISSLSEAARVDLCHFVLTRPHDCSDEAWLARLDYAVSRGTDFKPNNALSRALHGPSFFGRPHADTPETIRIRATRDAFIRESIEKTPAAATHHAWDDAAWSDDERSPGMRS